MRGIAGTETFGGTLSFRIINATSKPQVSPPWVGTRTSTAVKNALRWRGIGSLVAKNALPGNGAPSSEAPHSTRSSLVPSETQWRAVSNRLGAINVAVHSALEVI